MFTVESRLLWCGEVFSVSLQHSGAIYWRNVSSDILLEFAISVGIEIFYKIEFEVPGFMQLQFEISFSMRKNSRKRIFRLDFCKYMECISTEFPKVQNFSSYLMDERKLSIPMSYIGKWCDLQPIHTSIANVYVWQHLKVKVVFSIGGIEIIFLSYTHFVISLCHFTKQNKIPVLSLSLSLLFFVSLKTNLSSDCMNCKHIGQR